MENSNNICLIRCLSRVLTLLFSSMVFSKVYYNAFAGSRVRAEQSSFLSVNLSREPGSLLFVGSCAERAAIGGQVASKLALQHFITGTAEAREAASADAVASESSLVALEAGFRTANTAVYEFGHKLSAGGRMAASLVSVFVREGFIAVGRVGNGVAYLSRAGKVFPFFSPHSPDHEILAIGANSIVSVELASVPGAAGDVILIFSEPLPQEEESELGYSVSLLLPKFDQIEPFNSAAKSSPVQTSERFDMRSCERLTRQLFGERNPAFSSIVAFGPEVNFLESNSCL